MRNIASDTSTLLGGLCCRPSAVRSSDSTTTMRTKLVIMIRIEGAIDSTVIRAMICTMRSVKRPLPLRSMERPPLAAVRPRRPRALAGARQSWARQSACGQDQQQGPRISGESLSMDPCALAMRRPERGMPEYSRSGGAFGSGQNQMFDIVAADDEQALARPHHQCLDNRQALVCSTARVTPGTPNAARRQAGARRPGPAPTAARRR